MIVPQRDELTALLKKHGASKRLQRDIRYVPEEITYADERDFLAVTNKAENEGVLVYENVVVPFTLSKRSANSRGRVEAIICDICATWQRGTNSAVMTLKKDAKHSISHLVCAGLDCSLHVRDLTDVAKLSRTQLREYITPEDRVKRLKTRLAEILDAKMVQ
jgi:hypothetical protein